jgi:transposase
VPVCPAIPVCACARPCCHRPRRYPSDTTDAEWALIAPLLPVPACQTQRAAARRPTAAGRWWTRSGTSSTTGAYGGHCRPTSRPGALSTPLLASAACGCSSPHWRCCRRTEGAQAAAGCLRAGSPAGPAGHGRYGCALAAVSFRDHVAKRGGCGCRAACTR